MLKAISKGTVILSAALVVAIATACENHTQPRGETDRTAEAYVNGCKSNWVTAYHPIQATIGILRNTDFAASDYLILKSGSDSQTRYEFHAIILADDRAELVTSSTTMLDAARFEISSDIARQWIERFRNLPSIADGILVGEISRVSHVPCEFLLSSYRGAESRVVLVGIIDDDPYVTFVADLYEFVAAFVSDVEQPTSTQILAVPAKDKLDTLRTKIESDTFFEISGKDVKE